MNIIGTVIRSIIYKIPLKLLLILVAVFGVLFACFSSADDVGDLIQKVCPATDTNCDYLFNDKTFTNSYQVILDLTNNSTNIDIRGHTVCMKFSNRSSTSAQDIFLGPVSNLNNPTPYNVLEFDQKTLDYQCMYVRSTQIAIRGKYAVGSADTTVDIEMFLLDDLLANALPKMSSNDCQTEYNLIPISSVDSTYCEENNLCSSSDCPGGDLTPGVSNIFINDIFHPGAFNVIMNIPEEIDWDYAYTNSGSNFNLDVVGYNQDEEYIQSVIDVQNYKPTSDDFTRVFSNISNFGALLIACLFVILVFYMIKKIFK